MPPQKRARSEPAPELTTSTGGNKVSSTAGKKVRMTATLKAIPHRRTKAEVIAAIESHSVHTNEGESRLEVSQEMGRHRGGDRCAALQLHSTPRDSQGNCAVA